MCYHKRTVYSCKHNGWGRQVLSCYLQKAFLDGTFSKTCEVMNAHPLHSYSVDILCYICSKKQKKMHGTLVKLKAELKEASERLARHQKKEGGNEEEQLILTKHAASVAFDDGEFDEILLLGYTTLSAELKSIVA